MRKKVGRPSKIDKEAMKGFNVSFIIVIIIFMVLLSLTALTIINPSFYEALKASIINLFK